MHCINADFTAFVSEAFAVMLCIELLSCNIWVNLCEIAELSLSLTEPCALV